MVSTNPARGMRDFLPADVRKREYVIGVIKEVYESYGFEPLETPAVENLETLMGKYGEEGNQLIFPVLKRGEKLREALDPENPQSAIRDPRSLADLALRYDLTVPLARVVANNKNELPKFFKRYQIQPVWRADRPARGRFREFYQCDVDLVGSQSIVVELELISAISEILRRLGFNDFTIRLNHRDLLFSLLKISGIPSDKFGDAVVAIDKIDKIGPHKVQKELLKSGIAQDDIGKLISAMEFLVTDNPTLTAREKNHLISFYKLTTNIELEMSQSMLDLSRNIKAMLGVDPEIYDLADISKTSHNSIALFRLFDMLLEDPVGTKACEMLRSIWMLARLNGLGTKIKVDPSLARGLSYYTGTIMEVDVGKEIGSLGGGGRYDGLIGMFGKEQIPACGFSLGLERILVVMEERGMFPPEIADSTPADVMVTIFSEETTAESLKLASELREQGVRVTLYPEPDRLGKQIKYADSIKVPFVCVLGESELAEGKVTLKNMKSGEQQTVDRGSLAEAVKK